VEDLKVNTLFFGVANLLSFRHFLHCQQAHPHLGYFTALENSRR
jgi:hypothetical protein